MSIKIRDFDLSVKAVQPDGFFSGYGSVFGVVDSYNEIVAPGAFASSLADRAAKGRKLPILWQHQSDRPLGVYEVVKEDARGLYLEGQLLVGDVAQAREAHALMKAGAISGLSIGYWPRASSLDDKTGVRTLTAVDLDEVSIVTRPANDEARIDVVKMKLAHGGLPTLPEFERLLREAGFSKTQAAVIANRGLSHVLRREAEAPAESFGGLSAIAAHLRSFSLDI